MSEPRTTSTTDHRRFLLDHPSERRRHLWLALVLPCVVLCAVHLALATTVEVPQKGDELVYLGNARYLATGEGLVDPTGRDPYKIGYSLLLLPAFWLDASPLGGFAWVQVINSLLLTALYPALFVLARRLAPTLKLLDHVLLASCLSCYPAVLLYGTTAMSENAFLPLFAWLVAVAHKALQGQRGRDWAMLAVLTMFLYFVHERALGILLTVSGVVALTGFLELRRGTRRWGWVLYPTMAMMTYGALRAVEVPGSRWQTGTRGSGFVRQALALPESLVATFAGHLWYLTLATVGCLGLGLILRWLESRQPGTENPSSRAVPLFWWLLAGSAGSVLAVSTIFLAQRDEAQFTHWVYGRYCEGVLLPVMLVALLALQSLSVDTLPLQRTPSLQRTLPFRRKGLALVSVVMAVVTLAVVILAVVLVGLWTQAMGIAYSFNTTSLPIFNLPLGAGIFRSTAVFLGIAAALWLTFLWRWRVGLVGLSIFFLLSTAVTLRDSWAERAAETARQHSLADLVRQLDPPHQVILHEPQGKVHHFHFYNLSYFLPEYRFVIFGKKVQESPPGELVLSSDLDFARRHPGSRLLASERMPPISPGYTQSLWVLPGSFSRYLEGRGYWAVKTSP